MDNQEGLERAEGRKPRGKLRPGVFWGLLLVVGFGIYGLVYGFGSLGGFFGQTAPVVSRTLNEVISPGSRDKLAAEIDLQETQETKDNRTATPRPTPPVAAETELLPDNTPSRTDEPAVKRTKKTKKTKHKEVSRGEGNSTYGGASPKETIAGSPPLDTAASSASAASVAASTSKNRVSSKTSSGGVSTASERCTFKTRGEPSHQVLINEIAWMGSPPKGGGQGSGSGKSEWIELKNNSRETVNLSGWQILDKSRKFKILFENDEKITASGFYLLERTRKGASPDAAADKIYMSVLPNAGSWLKLISRECALVDEINASAGWPGGNNKSKQTLERNLGDLGWHTSIYPGGTPKAENSKPQIAEATQGSTTIKTPHPKTSQPPAKTTSTTSAAINHLVIAEVQIAGARTTNDFIKIYNPGNSAIDATNWRIRKKTQSGAEYSVKVFPVGSVIQPLGYFLWANSADGFAAAVGAHTSSAETLADNNSVALFHGSGVLVDAVAWGSGHKNPFVETAPYPKNPGANQSLKRKFTKGAVVDTDNNSKDFAI